MGCLSALQASAPSAPHPRSPGLTLRVTPQLPATATSTGARRAARYVMSAPRRFAGPLSPSSSRRPRRFLEASWKAWESSVAPRPPGIRVHPSFPSPRRPSQVCHARERGTSERGARRVCRRPQQNRLSGPWQAGPDPLQQHLRGQRYCSLSLTRGRAGRALHSQPELGLLKLIFCYLRRSCLTRESSSVEGSLLFSAGNSQRQVWRPLGWPYSGS